MVNVSVCRPLNLFLPLYFPFLLMVRYFLTSYSCFHVVLSLVFDISICYLFYFYLYPIITLLSWSLLLILIVLFFWFCYFSVSEFSVFHPFFVHFSVSVVFVQMFSSWIEVKDIDVHLLKVPAVRNVVALQKKSWRSNQQRNLYFIFEFKKDHKM